MCGTLLVGLGYNLAELFGTHELVFHSNKGGEYVNDLWGNAHLM